MITPQRAIAKGKELENYVRDQLIAHGLDARAERTPASGAGNRKKGDIDNNIGWCFECKNTQTINWQQTWKQVEREAMNQQTPVVIWHPQGVPLASSVAVINIQEFFDLLKAKRDNASKGDILDRWSVKNNLDKAVYYLKQVIKNI